MSSYLIFMFMISATYVFIGDGLVPCNSRPRKISLQSNNPSGFSANDAPSTESNIDKVLHDYQGVLSGVKDVKTAHYYSTNIDIAEAYHLVKDNGYIERIAAKEAASIGMNTQQYISRIASNAETFIMQRTVWSQHELMELLDTIINRKGLFTCLLGGGSTGKSLIFKNLVKRKKEKVILLNMRKNSNILSNFLEKLDNQEETKSIIAAAEIFVKEKIGANLDIPSIACRGKSHDQFRLFSFLLETLIKKGQLTTIIIDEANRALRRTDIEEVTLVKEILALFVCLTKETSELNVILVSSDHSLPFRLQSPELGMKNELLHTLIYSGEVPPNEMYTLLIEVWGMGDHLAMALMSLYGGHIYNTFEALQQLDSFPTYPFRDFNSFLFSNVMNCLADSSDKIGMVKTLRNLAEKGFSSLEMADDPVAEVISKYNVGGVVPDSGKVLGLPIELWGKDSFGIIPVSQSMRLIIAEVLHAKEAV